MKITKNVVHSADAAFLVAKRALFISTMHKKAGKGVQRGILDLVVAARRQLVQ